MCEHEIHFSSRLSRPAKIVWLVLLCASLQSAKAGKWIFDFRSGVLYDSNVSNSDRPDEREADLAWRSDFAAGQSFQLNDDLRLSVFGEVESHLWATYDGLSNIRPGLVPSLRYRFGLGKNAPWIRLETKAGYANFAESGRSGWEVRPGLRGGLSMAEHVALEVGYEYQHYAAREAVWEQDGHSVSLRGKIELTSSTQLSIGYSYRYGDVTAAAIPPRPDFVAIADVREFINTFDELYMAYRFPASTHAGSIGLSQTLGHGVALQASYEYRYTTHDSLHYLNHATQLALAISF